MTSLEHTDLLIGYWMANIWQFILVLLAVSDEIHYIFPINNKETLSIDRTTHHGMKEMLYLKAGRKEGSALFRHTVSTFYLCYMVSDIL